MFTPQRGKGLSEYRWMDTTKCIISLASRLIKILLQGLRKFSDILTILICPLLPIINVKSLSKLAQRPFKFSSLYTALLTGSDKSWKLHTVWKSPSHFHVCTLLFGLFALSGRIFQRFIARANVWKIWDKIAHFFVRYMWFDCLGPTHTKIWC